MTTRTANTQTPKATVITGLSHEGVEAIATDLRVLLANVFGLYVKTKNFHWHMRGHHFRDYHLLLDEHSDQIFAMTDDIAERARKIGGTTIRSIGDIARHQTLSDNDEISVKPLDMLRELLADNRRVRAEMLATHAVCEQYSDVATASLLENWIDQTERRAWFLEETVSHE